MPHSKMNSVEVSIAGERWRVRVIEDDVPSDRVFEDPALARTHARDEASRLCVIAPVEMTETRPA